MVEVIRVVRLDRLIEVARVVRVFLVNGMVMKMFDFRFNVSRCILYYQHLGSQQWTTSAWI